MAASPQRILVAREGLLDRLIFAAGGEPRDPRRGRTPQLSNEQLTRKFKAAMEGRMRRQGKGMQPRKKKSKD